MFYSQFILAKKGPLGTIWIAAHLERKLRKNQVADTDIGVSVDSILFPDVPIALRLSSHLLLGVVRIYSRKVNYLFDDCSEALLKVKQAFRSAAVDLLPEESKAPYHSITLPETFDLDDFELPDNDILQSNYVDHHISSREQITLQDTLEGAGYSTSKFGLDERFGDGDASGLDIDEELFLDKIGTSGHTNDSADPQVSAQPMTPLQRDEHPEERTANSEIRIVGVSEDVDLVDYAQAPCTPGLVEEPNFSNIQGASACDDHLESDHLIEAVVKENTENITYEDKQNVDCCDDTKSDAVPLVVPHENGYHSSVLAIKELKSQGESLSIESTAEHVSQDEPSLKEGPSSDISDQVKAKRVALGLAGKMTEASDVLGREDLQNGVDNNDNTEVLSVNEHCDDRQGPSEIGLEESTCDISGSTSTWQQVPEDASGKDQASLGIEIPDSVGIASDLEKSYTSNASESGAKDQGEPCLEKHEALSCKETKDVDIRNHDLHEEMLSTEPHFLRPCDSIMEEPDLPNSGHDMPMDADAPPDIAVSGSVETSGGEVPVMPGEAWHGTDDSRQFPNENHVQNLATCEDINAAFSKPDGQVDNIISEDVQVENINNSAEAHCPAPEKLLSVPEAHADVPGEMLLDATPRDLQGLDEDDAGRRIFSGKKHSLTESTLAEQSLNSVESSRIVRVKRTAESVPDDDDLLSSILVGKSSVLKIKPTPPLPELKSLKRARITPRTAAPKRKILMDDTMVLHGDLIRQQLTKTEDIRRVRKKAPCTNPEISMIRKQQLEDEIFLEPIFSGMSIELASLHSQVYDLSGIRVYQNDVNVSLETASEPRLTSQNDVNDVLLGSGAEPKLSSQHEESVTSLQTAAEPESVPQNTENGIGMDMEKDKGSSELNVTEESGQGPHSELLVIRDNEEAELDETSLLSQNKLEEVDDTCIEVNINQEQMKPENDSLEPDVLQQNLLQNEAEVEISDRNADAENPASCDIVDVSAGMVQTAPLYETDDANSYGNALDILPDQKIGAPSIELDTSVMDASDGKIIGTDEVTEKDGGIIAEYKTEFLARNNDLLEVARDGAAVELLPDANHGDLEYNVQSEIYNAISGDQIVGPSYQPQVGLLFEGGFLDGGENPNMHEAYQPNTLDAKVSGFDLHDRNDLYSASGNDTEFLNVDEEETEIADDYMPDPEETRFIENSGWSSRTRAVSKYLQTLFVKEADSGRKSLSMDSLLIGKTRKEASRMFFEALVLKTRDYIHVEQRNPFDNIDIKSRMKLRKSDF
ncbi:sister chromatid cohesion 1 protein 4-like [Forsythia ovata]|uniref:Sister chromatid cohesion 1 protein 4-like n=1 Tax=Forsythia ovata TaxID=205694 RepID=A0ABD1R1D4_9LAMI